MFRMARLTSVFIVVLVAGAAIAALTQRMALSGQESLKPTPPAIEIYSPAFSANPVDSSDHIDSRQIILPVGPTDTTLNCRFGYNLARQSITFFDPSELARLRAGWFSQWTVSVSPTGVNGMEFVQVVRLHQVKTGGNFDDPYVDPYTYTIRSPGGATLADSLAQLESIAGNNPGLLWLVGNEMEREDWPGGSQDEMVPELYAVAYHQIYQAIKNSDPTAQVAIGGVVQATPLRLTYLDRVWDEYWRLFGERMPVDVWNIHAFILREKRYFAGCADCWGAGVPAGIDDVDSGILFDTGDNKDFDIALEHVRAFRQWMRNKGERNKPLIVSEYGVLMPPEWDGFSFENVRDEFMYPSFDMFLHERDVETGYPADDNRLVQRWLWFSLDYDELHPISGDHVFNGWLFHSGLETEPAGIAPLGEYWEDYVTISAPQEIDLLPGLAWTVPAAGFAISDPVTMTLFVEVANSGSIRAGQAFTVGIYQETDGTLLGSATVTDLAGCGGKVIISATWPNLTPGVHYAQVKVDPGDGVSFEANELNNETLVAVVVATERVFLPNVLKTD